MKYRLATVALIIVGSLGHADNGKILATSGVGPIEGGAGGGIIPWAMLSGYATRDEVGLSATMSEADVKDYTLSSHGVALGLYDRVETSFSQLRFQNKTNSVDIKQNILGIKTRLYGDALYGTWPQFSLGLQHKSLLDKAVANSLGARDTKGTDIYLSTAKIWLAGPLMRTALLNANLRYSKANQLGLLGYGTKSSDHADILFEVAAALFIHRRIAVGLEYREKPDNINNVKEEDWQDVFIAYFPSKSLSITLAYLQLGEIATLKDQTGTYFSIQGSF